MSGVRSASNRMPLLKPSGFKGVSAVTTCLLCAAAGPDKVNGSAAASSRAVTRRLRSYGVWFGGGGVRAGRAGSRQNGRRHPPGAMRAAGDPGANEEMLRKS